MDKMISASFVLLVALLIVEALAISSASGLTAADAALNKAGWIAKQYTLNDETYKYDGINNSLKVVPAQNTVSIMGVAAASDPAKYTFKATFNSSHAGYGNRAGKILAQAVTPHTATITVKNNQVISATIDGRWNMMTERAI
jgi:hypothetical protein